jgi:hypothetical protein
VPEGRKVKPEQFDEFYAFIAKRIGQTRREVLAWAVRAVQREPKDMTPGDWDNLRTELVGFLWWGGGTIPDSTSSPTLGQQRLFDNKGLVRPSQEDAKAMLDRMGAMIAAVIKREHVPVMKMNGTLILRLASTYYGSSEPYWMQTWEGVRFDWPDRAALALGSLIEREGLLLKECPALLPRDEEICGTWFVATRPRQEYCSGTCQSRASTRAAREGTETPAEKRRKARKEG